MEFHVSCAANICKNLPDMLRLFLKHQVDYWSQSKMYFPALLNIWMFTQHLIMSRSFCELHIINARLINSSCLGGTWQILMFMVWWLFWVFWHCISLEEIGVNISVGVSPRPKCVSSLMMWKEVKNALRHEGINHREGWDIGRVPLI